MKPQMKRPRLHDLVLVPATLALLLGIAACGNNNAPINTPSNPMPGTAPGSNAVMVHIPANAMSMGTNAFGANPLVVPVGTTVTWTNDDSMAHTVTSDAGRFDSGNIAPGHTFSFTFSSAGTFSYHCAIHPDMRGSVQVGSTSPTPTPTFRNSDGDGDNNGDTDNDGV